MSPDAAIPARRSRRLVPPGIKPEDRSGHAKGAHGPQMDLIFRAPVKKPLDEADHAPGVIAQGGGARWWCCITTLTASPLSRTVRYVRYSTR